MKDNEVLNLPRLAKLWDIVVCPTEGHKCFLILRDFTIGDWYSDNGIVPLGRQNRHSAWCTECEEYLFYGKHERYGFRKLLRKGKLITG